jgi:hypothetical protein
MIIVSISNSRHKDKEKETVKEKVKEFFNEKGNVDTATLVKRQFGDEACDRLQLNNNFNSELYLRTGRFKKWKPADQTKGANSGSFCYSDETSFCESDAFSSDKHQGLIKSKSITSQGQANTTVAANNKCVFEIDLGNVNEENLASFWSAVGDGNCTTLNSNLINENGRLIREGNGLESNIRFVKANIENQGSTIGSLTDIEAVKSASNQSLINFIDRIRPQIRQVIDEKVMKVDQMNSNERRCAQLSNVLTASNASCQVSLSNVTTAYLQNWSNMRDLQLQFNSLKINYDNAQIVLNSNMVILGNLNSEYATVYNEWQRNLSNLYTSNIQLNFVKSSNLMCQSNLNVVTGQIAFAEASYVSAYDVYKQCETDLSGCTAMSNTKVAALKDVTFNLIPKCTTTNDACQRNVYKLNTEIESLKKTLSFDQANYKDETCAPWQGRIDALSAYSNWLVEKCIKSKDTSLSTISNLVDDIRNKTQDKVKACQANKSSLVGDPNSDLFVIDKHVSFCPYGQRCHLANYDEAVQKCPARCSNAEYNLKSVPNAKGSKYVGFLDMGDDRSGCYCSYTGTPGDFEQAKADNLEALMAAGETLPRGSYRANVVFSTGGGFSNYYPHNCKSCIAQNKFLACDCVDVTSGLWIASMLDLSNCPLGTDITNQKGKLTCGGTNTGKSYRGNTNVAGGENLGSVTDIADSQNPTPYEILTGLPQPW